MNVLVLSPALYDTAPGLRFRIEQWARHLERDGDRFTFVPFEDEALHRVIYRPGNYARKIMLMLRACLRRLGVVRSLREFDLVYLAREASLLGPAVIERLISLTGKPLVYDFDDPVWLPYESPTNRLFSRLKCPGKTASICRLASHVIAGNRLLADWARQHTPHVTVIPSTIDLERYPLKSTAASQETVTLGWTGSHSTLPFLDLLQGTLARLGERYRLRLLVISHTDQFRLPELPIDVVSRRWNAATEARDLHEIDIGLGPFPSSGWTPWRCHGKVLQYMACGIPTVASRLGILPDYIDDGRNGFLADGDQEWYDKLARLIEQPALRQQLGQAGRLRIEQRYAAGTWATTLRDVLQTAIGNSIRTPAEVVARCSAE